jgi:hypothetical protein
MWYLIGMLVTLACFIASPFVRYREYWNSILHTINVKKNLWECLWGHIILSMIPISLNYTEYQKEVCEFGTIFPVFWSIVAILALSVIWIITVSAIIGFLIVCYIKKSVEDYFESKVNKESTQTDTKKSQS